MQSKACGHRELCGSPASPLSSVSCHDWSEEWVLGEQQGAGTQKWWDPRKHLVLKGLVTCSDVQPQSEQHVLWRWEAQDQGLLMPLIQESQWETCVFCSG